MAFSPRREFFAKLALLSGFAALGGATPAKAQAPSKRFIKREAAERSGASLSELKNLFKTSSLKQAALEGDVEWGKVEAGQSAGLGEEILPAAEVFRRLVAETEAARRRLASL